MDMRQLQYFAEFSIDLNYSRAAKRLYISQQGLSKSIHALERELGVQLVDVRNHRAELTPCGEILKSRCRELINSWDETHQMLIAAERQHPRHQTLRVNESPAFRSMIAHNLNSEFVALHPEVTVQQDSLLDYESEEALRRGAFDAIIGMGPLPGEDIDNRTLFEFPAYMMMPLRHTLAHEKVLHLSQICQEPIVVLDKKFRTYQLFLRACGAVGLVPQIGFFASTSLIMHQLCYDHGMMGLAIRRASLEQNGNLCHVLLNPQEFTFKICLSMMAGRHKSIALERYISFMTNYDYEKYGAFPKI